MLCARFAICRLVSGQVMAQPLRYILGNNLLGVLWSAFLPIANKDDILASVSFWAVIS